MGRPHTGSLHGHAAGHKLRQARDWTSVSTLLLVAQG